MVSSAAASRDRSLPRRSPPGVCFRRCVDRRRGRSSRLASGASAADAVADANWRWHDARRDSPRDSRPSLLRRRRASPRTRLPRSRRSPSPATPPPATSPPCASGLSDGDGVGGSLPPAAARASDANADSLCGTPSKSSGRGSSGVSVPLSSDPMKSTVDCRARTCSCAAAARAAMTLSSCASEEEEGSGRRRGGEKRTHRTRARGRRENRSIDASTAVPPPTRSARGRARRRRGDARRRGRRAGMNRARIGIGRARAHLPGGDEIYRHLRGRRDGPSRRAFEEAGRECNATPSRALRRRRASARVDASDARATSRGFFERLRARSLRRRAAGARRVVPAGGGC
jgi:hypothetical protein